MRNDVSRPWNIASRNHNRAGTGARYRAVIERKNVGNTRGNKLNGHVVPSKWKIQSIFVLSTKTKRRLKAVEKRQRTVELKIIDSSWTKCLAGINKRARWRKRLKRVISIRSLGRVSFFSFRSRICKLSRIRRGPRGPSVCFLQDHFGPKEHASKAAIA